MNKVVPAPPRFERPSALGFMGWIAAVAVIAWSFQGAAWSFSELVSGLPALADFLSRSWPPSVNRLPSISRALVETFQMALAGTLVGVILSLPLAILAAAGLTPNRLVYGLSRALIALFRTVPDLVWALIFVIVVGLGPFAGTLAIVIDTIGFCARFFAEAMEEADRGPQEALTAIGAGRGDVVMTAVFPSALPSFIATSLFALEKSARSSVILGLVGAGGIGLELKVAMDLFEYQEAMTIILLIFALVVAVERLGSWARRRTLST